MNTITVYEIGDDVTVENVKPLGNNEHAPELKLGEKKKVKDIFVDSKGFQHLDVGLKSYLNYVRSFETGETLPKSDEIHWCHPSRFSKD